MKNSLTIGSMTKQNLFGLTLAQLQELCSAEGMPRFAARQICDWLYLKRVDCIDAMTNLSLKARARLSEIAVVERPAPISCQVSADGTKKYLFALGHQPAAGSNQPSGVSHSAVCPLQSALIESVFIPDGDRATLCISCQAGCRMGCRFCVTGQQGFHGNLSAAEILNQVFSIPEFDRLTNIVYMGMGEPMDNLDAVLDSTRVLTSDWGLGWSPRRITVSSVGIIPGLRRFIDESQCHVAVSLHNPFAAERLQIMPMQKAYPIADVVALLKRYDWSGQRRISFEYTMFRGLNDDERHAAELVRLLRGLCCRVNLIRFHTSPDTPFRTAAPQAMAAFRDYLNAHGVTCTIRASRGEDIMAACGLLAGSAQPADS